MEILSRAQPKRDYYYTSPLGCRLFDLGLGPIALSMCGAGTPEDLALIERCLGKAGTAGFAAEFLRAKGLGWAADLLPAWAGHRMPATAASLIAAE